MGTISTKPLAVVTGASSGIGRALAKELARRGYDLVVCADEDEINDAARELESLGASAIPVKGDLATFDGVEELWRTAQSAARPIEVVALNAGVGVGGDFARETKLEDELELIELNCASVVHLAKLAAKHMVASGRGRILITSSIAALMPSPLEAVYGASKAFDLQFAKALRNELEGTGVTVTAVEPGPTDTRFFERAGLEGTKVDEEKSKNSPEDVARQAIDALMAGEASVVAASSFMTKLEGTIAPHLPDELKASMHRRQVEKK